MILIDSNILIDLLQNNPIWKPWSIEQLRAASARETLCINMVIYAELSANFNMAQELDTFLDKVRITVEPISHQAAFLAGQAFRQYRQNKGTKSGVLPDFFIGAHAQAQRHTLLTRDRARYQRYFPSVTLIAPD